MTSFTISDDDLQSLKDQVVVITGGSSGIGLATVKRLLGIGAKVVVGDLNEPPEPEKSQVTYLKVDATSWKEQLELFKKAKEKYGTVNHAFANAGIKPTVSLLEDDVDKNGDLLPPKLDTINVNLIGVMYTIKLAIYYIKQNSEGGSIVISGSGSSFRRFSPTDYTTTKHGVTGLVRSLYGNLHPTIPIRVNAIAPSWTDTGILSREMFAAMGDLVQPADVVARSVILLMADKNRHGEMIYSECGKFWEIEKGEDGLNQYASKMLGQSGEGPEEGVFRKLKKMAEEMAAAAKV
ncbi:NAD(P)-binding protein [Zopfia rhizophila CBS 207.26]|uniref:NAD(P)-binding protein n=1 Tax=Zopfia rhizophila CBS 207.26 TaxID=1314779 RepID=A0A6A6ER03_9PEZI|nr:NAD(P)-binding protein [Zopfia rhizophila CBS 207.26]